MILRNRSAVPLRGFAAILAAALIPAIAGCEAGTNAPTQRWHQPTAGASSVLDNTIRVSNMFVLGAPPDSALTGGESAGLFFALSNVGAADKLIAVQAPGSATSVQLPGGGVSLGSNQSVFLTGPAPQVVLENLTRTLVGGQWIKVVLTFQKAGTKTLRVPVMPQAQYYATFSPAPASPAPSPSPTTTGKKKKAHGATASPTPTPTPAG